MFFVYAGALVVGAVILLLDLFIAFVGTIALNRAVQLRLRGAEVTGHVVQIRQRPGRTVSVRVAYETPAGKFETSGTSQRPRLGEPVTVRYDPDSPARATTWIRPARRAAIGIPVVLVVTAVSAGMIVGGAFYFAGIHSSLQAPLTSGSLVLAVALATANYAVSQCAQWVRWGRMVQAPGKIKRFDEHATGGRGVLVSFESADGQEEFWARTGSVVARVGDTVTVYYDPSRPTRSATVEPSATVRAYAIGGTVVALALFALVAVAASQL